MFPQLDALVIVVLLVLILVQTVGVAVHLPRVQVPEQVQSGGDAGMAHDLLQQEPAPIGRTNAERGAASVSETGTDLQCAGPNEPLTTS